MATTITQGVIQKVNPAKWKEHRYGLSLERWISLRGKNFWITGAGTGYGRSIAVALASADANVFLTGRRREKLQESLEEMKSLGIPTRNCHIIESDITNFDKVKRACDKITNLCNSLYGLINNAAMPSRDGLTYPLQEESIEYWEQMMRLNVTAPWFLTRIIIPHMKHGGAIRVLFTTSEAGWASTSGFGMYNISKAALNSLCSSMAEEYAIRFPKLDVQMNALVPGEAKTEMNPNSKESPYAIVSMALFLLSHPKGGPNGKFFHRDGRHLQFAYTIPYDKSLI